MKEKIRLAVIIDNKMYEYKGLSCKYCDLRGDCKDLCEAFGVSGSFALVGEVEKVNIEKGNNEE